MSNLSNWKFFRTCCLITALMILPVTLIAGQLHLILVADYYALDLMPSLKYDIEAMTRESRNIESQTDLKVLKTIFTGEKTRTSSLLHTLKSLKAGPDDVIVFYFTGHGFRTPSKGDNPWPDLYFTAEDKAIDLRVIIEILEKKGARLSMIIADCCNNVIADDQVTMAKVPSYKGKGSKLIRNNYRKLFLNTQGMIVAAACEAGQASLALLNLGSMYTQSLLHCLHDSVKQSSDMVDWQVILDAATIKSETWAQSYNHEQNPIFLISP